ncbi:SusC/RagA family protein [Terrimonas sp.]|uniref:SusC/RagA family TonB-linked outer membrane protein n=1 Tax=Terrimonas sp. TaxID=1914338 RepID=UPI000D52474A|nr:SusC/RagA family TonB-linked outer membrane protein [Terrimonas sp.]PVD53768.1 SusC/RagA family protein [Terrimonas sp.]
MRNCQKAPACILCLPGILLLTILFFLASDVAAKPLKSVYPPEHLHFGDTVTVRGKVSDADENVVLGGVSIENLRTRKGTTSNADGEFAIGAEVGDQLSFTFIGRAPKTIVYRGEKFLSVTLAKTEGALSEVIITGFQNLDKKKFSGAATSLKAADVKIDGVADVSRMLEGRAAGVSVQNISGTFGAAPKIRIRGATSINGENKPLWVVDGVVLEDIVNISNDQLSSGDPTTLLGSSVAGINVNDIESFDILKDAAATALYGARAMNGVVVITTKKGRAGRQTVNYTGNYSTQFKPQYADYNIMNSAQQMSVVSELDRKGWLTTNVLKNGNYGVYGKYYDLINEVLPDGNFAMPNTQEAKREYLLRYAKANTDWFDILFRQSFIQEHSLSISSGTERLQSFFSTSFYNDNGWTLADNVKRYTLNFRNNYTFSDKFSAGFLTTGSYRQQEAPGTVSRTANAVTGAYDRNFDINPFSFALNTNRTITAFDENGDREYFTRNFAPFNVLTELENNKLKINVIDLKLQGEATYKFTPHLRYEFIGALRYVRSTREHEVTENSNMANAYRAAGTSEIRRNNPFLYQDPENPSAEKVVVLPYGGFYNRVEDQLLNFDVRNSLNYARKFGEDDEHDLNLLLGQQIKYADRQNASSNGYGYQYDNGGVASPDFQILKQMIEQNYPYYGMSKDFDRFAAFYFNAQYTFKDKYNFYGTVRYDGSNRLGSSRQARWLPTWSFGGAWNINEEGFLRDVDAVNYLKLRASYGLTASLGPATNSNIVLRTINIHRPYLTDVETIIYIANLANTELTWEKNYTANIGLDAGLFNNRLTASIDVYHRNSFDLIGLIKTSGIGGEYLKTANYADMTSRGAELLIGGQPIVRKNWNWKVNLTFGYNTTKITNSEYLPQIFDLVKQEGGNLQGYPVNGLFSIKYAGLNANTGVPEFINEEGKTSSAVFMQSDSVRNLKFEGSIDPKITGGLNNTFTYKAFSLNIFITYQLGNKIRLAPAFKNNYSEWDATPKEFYDRWVMPGDQNTTNIPSIMDYYQYILVNSTSFNYPYNNYNYSTERVARGDFIRLKTVSLSYQLPAAMLQKTNFFKTVSVTAAAINPWLIYSDKKLKGQDPEFFNAGGVAQPVQKQITLSLKVGL